MCVSDRMDIDPERERCFHAFMYMGVCVCVYVCMRVCVRESEMVCFHVRTKPCLHQH